MAARLRGDVEEHWTTLLVGALVAIFAWQLDGPAPMGNTLDAAWHVAIQVAYHDGLDFGTDAVYTYGPLGWLQEPDAIYKSQYAGAIAYHWLALTVVCVLLVFNLRRTFGLGLAAVWTYLFAIIAAQEVTPTLIGVVSVTMFVHLPGRPQREQLAWLVPYAGFIGVMSLGKGSFAAVAAALGILVAFALPSRKLAVPLFGGVALVTSVALFVLTGQPLGTYDEFVRNTLQVASGYAEVMGHEDPALAYQYLIAGCLAIGGAVAIWRTMDADPKTKPWLLAGWTAYCFFTAKSAFVRHDTGHALNFFMPVPVALASLAWWRWGRGAATAGLLLALAVAIPAIFGGRGLEIDPLDGPDRFVNTVDGALGDDVLKASAETKARIKVDGPGPKVLAAVAGHSVDARPYQASTPWAEGLKWSPLPVFQAYTAYTKELDELGADRLEGGEAPERIIRASNEVSFRVDGRFEAFDTPLTVRKIVCGFEVVAADLRWAALARTRPDCGPERRLRKVKAKWGERVEVPEPSGPRRAVGVRVDGVEVSGLERIRTFLTRSKMRRFLLDRDAGRIVPSAPASGLLLRSSRGFDLQAPFQLIPQAKKLGFEQVGGNPDDELTFEFYEIGLSP